MEIVALTAYSTEMFATKCYETGMNQFLTKPVDALKLKQVVQQLQL
jgi:CheY-like chemotaxis protein